MCTLFDFRGLRVIHKYFIPVQEHSVLSERVVIDRIETPHRPEEFFIHV